MDALIGVRKTRLGCGSLILLSALYCFPGHPSAGGATLLDVLLHVGLFAGAALWFGLLTGRRRWTVATLAGLGALLEVVQWWIGGYARIEGPDIVANEAGVALAALLLWLGWWRWKGLSAGRTGTRDQ